MEHGPRAPCDANVPRLENLERHDRGVDQVPQFMSQQPDPLAPARGLSIEDELISFALILADGARDGVVKATVQRAKVIRADGPFVSTARWAVEPTVWPPSPCTA